LVTLADNLFAVEPCDPHRHALRNWHCVLDTDSLVSRHSKTIIEIDEQPGLAPVGRRGAA
jgi:hypothetical protein